MSLLVAVEYNAVSKFVLKNWADLILYVIEFVFWLKWAF